jgi:hypothetical protein
MYLGQIKCNEEVLQYGTDEQVRERLASLIDEVEKLNLDKSQERRLELLEEQLYFANELIDNLEKGLGEITRLTEYKKFFEANLSNSYFER